MSNMRGMKGLVLLFSLLSTLVPWCVATRGWVEEGYKAEEEYKAGVVQYTPSTSISSDYKQNIIKNVDGVYEAIIHNATAADGLDIVVVPELVLYYPGIAEALSKGKDALKEYAINVPEPSKSHPINPCEEVLPPGHIQNEFFLDALSCMAKKLQTYLVFNVIDLVESNSTAGSYKLFNTDVVFDRSGALVAKYWKMHTFGLSPLIDQPTGSQRIPTKFEADFGVTFGVAICFDIEFENPVQALLDQGVRHFVFNSAWVNNPPFGFATEIQQGWSRATQSVLLASNIGEGWMRSGSGIYYKGKKMVSFFNVDVAPNMLLTASIPKKMDAIRARDLPLKTKKGKEKKALIALNNPEAENSVIENETKDEVCTLDFLPHVSMKATCQSLVEKKSDKEVRFSLKEGDLQCDFSFHSLNLTAQTHDSIPIAAAFSSAIQFPHTVDKIHYSGCMVFLCIGYPTCASPYWQPLGRLAETKVQSHFPIKGRNIPLFSGVVKPGMVEARYISKYAHSEGKFGSSEVSITNTPDAENWSTINFGVISVATVQD
jgi:biotinidase